ncbi:hypothetical protein F4802DRAFT_116147 [Xylaria palmicola]|nr:hypothetical protein F4802DRAFT_116147 [Xylaria palmicola]
MRPVSCLLFLFLAKYLRRRVPSTVGSGSSPSGTHSVCRPPAVLERCESILLSRHLQLPILSICPPPSPRPPARCSAAYTYPGG